MTPSKKDPIVDDFITKVFGIDRKKSILEDTCVFCGEKAEEFKDKKSKKEFSISGMCQKCQDDTF